MILSNDFGGASAGCCASGGFIRHGLNLQARSWISSFVKEHDSESIGLNESGIGMNTIQAS
jgi:hypothetical protein